MLAVMLALDASILAIMGTFKLCMNPSMLATIHTVIVGLIVSALETVMIAIMRAFYFVVLPIVPIIPTIVVCERRSGRTEQNR